MGKTQKINRSELYNKYAIYLVFIVMIILSTILTNNFLKWSNIINILLQAAPIMMIACGETLVLICGMTDLAPGAVLAFSGCVGIGITQLTNNALLGGLTGIIAGILFGLISGIAVSRFNIPPFIATLATMNIARGAVYVYTDGKTLYNIGDFAFYGQGKIAGIHAPIVFMLGAILITYFLLNHTKFGRYLYAIGGNEYAAVASGVNSKRIKIIAYLIIGAFSGLAGVVLCSRLNSGVPSVGLSYEFDAIIAAVVGGTSFSGGIGTVGGTIVGCLIIALLNNMMNLMSVQAYWQLIVKGVVILLAVGVDMAKKRDRN